MHDTLRADGAVFCDSYLGSAPHDFGSLGDEYRSLRAGTGVVYWGECGYVEMTGTQSGYFLNRLATNKVEQIDVGSGQEAFMADPSGRIVEHILVFAEADRLILRSSPGRGPHQFKLLDFYLIREDVQLIDRSSQWFDLVVAGAESEDLLAEVTSVALPKNRLDHVTIPWWGKTVAVRRFTDTNYASFILTAEVDLLSDVWQTLRNAGAEACGLAAWDAVRIEQGWPQFGLDINEKTIPQEVGRNAQAISFDKGCYVGQETVARIDSRDGVRQLLSGLVIQSRVEPAVGSELTKAGQTVGRVTSACWSPGQQAVVALGYLQRDHTLPGTELTTTVGPAKVVELPMALAASP